MTFAGNDAAIVDARSLQPRLVLHGHTGTIRGACGSIDDLLATASRLVTRSLTAEERREYLPDGGGTTR